MVAMRMMQEVIDVVPVRHRFMAAAETMNVIYGMASDMFGRATIGILRRYLAVCSST
jgi:hypothetical protein